MRVQAAITLAVASAAPFLAPKQDSADPKDATSSFVESASLNDGQESESRFEQMQLSWAETADGKVELYQDPNGAPVVSGFAADPPEEEFDENGELLGGDIPDERNSLQLDDVPAPKFELVVPGEASGTVEADAVVVGDPATGDGFVQSGVSEIDAILDNTRGGEAVEEPVDGIDAAASMITSIIGGEEPEEEKTPEETIVTGGSEGGFWLRGARLNDVFQYLAQRGGYQFFHNAELEAPNFVVTGHLNDGDPFGQMEELGVMYGITVYKKGDTVYAMNEAQMAQLPTKPFQYQLRYLRANPDDTTQLRTILQPVLTPGTGLIEFEPKTNTMIVIDNERRIEMVKGILEELDKPKQQIAVETRILRVTSSSRNRIGVDWTSVLGDGLSFEATSALNSIFNLPEMDTVTDVITSVTDSQGRTGFTTAAVASLTPMAAGSGLSLSSEIPESSTGLDLSGTVEEPGFGLLAGTAGETGGTNGFSNGRTLTQSVSRNGSDLVLSPLQVQAVLRALNSGNLAQQESSPTMITEDNEEGLIQIIDRIPIILSTISETDAGQNITEEVRYYIDENDAVDDPTLTREIGVTVTITPTILPDNTIRMKMRPRSAQVTEFITGRSGNVFPRVNESTIDTIARVPNGYSLLVGGFYEEVEGDVTSKVPILGDIPIINFAFKSTDKQKEHTSLVFIVTPRAYSPVSIPETLSMTKELHERHVLPEDHAWPDRDKPGFNYESNLPWAVGNVASLYPENPPSSPLHPDHPVNEVVADDYQPEGLMPASRMEPAAPAAQTRQRRRGLFNGFFKGKKNGGR